MNRNKRFLKLFLSLSIAVLLLFAAGCAGNDQQTGSSSDTSEDPSGKTTSQPEYQNYDNPEYDENALNIQKVFPKNGAQGVITSCGIELRFDDNDIDLDTLEKCFSIEPAVEMNCSAQDGYFVFNPVDYYDENTTYTVTIDASLASSNGKKMTGDYKFSFTTESLLTSITDDILTISSASNGQAITALDTEAAGFFASIDLWSLSDDAEEPSSLDFQTTLYRIDSFDDFMAALIENYSMENDSRVSTGNPCKGMNLKEYASFTVNAGQYEGYYDTYYGEFPESLDAGWYLAEFTAEIQSVEVTKYKLVQSTPLSFVAAGAADELVCWLNDTSSGETVADAEISISGDYQAQGTTDDNGLCRISAAGSGSTYDCTADYEISYQSVSVSSDKGEFGDIYDRNISYSQEKTIRNQYYAYLASDRTIYQSTDTIEVFGMLKAKSEGVSTDGDLKVQFSEAYNYDDETAEMFECTVEQQENGTFTGTINIEDVKSGYYTLKLLLDDSKIYETSVNVQDYVKPVYKGSAQSEKIAYINTREDEKEAAIDLSVSYYDGTAAEGFHLSSVYSTDMTSDTETYTIGSDGTAKASLDISAVTSDSWRPVKIEAMYSGSDAEDENITLTSDFYVFTKDVMLLGENDSEKAEFTFNTYDINTDDLESQFDVYDYDKLKGDPTDSTIEVTLYKRYYEKVERETKYDPIYKTSYKVYDYEEHNDVIGTYTVNTKNGTGTLKYDSDLLSDKQPGECYYLECSMQDHSNETISEKFYLYESYINYDYSSNSYCMVPDEVIASEDGEQYYSGYLFTDGEDVSMHLTYNTDTYEMKDNEKLLNFIILPDGINDLAVSEDGTMNVQFREDLTPNYQVYGVLFDGKYYHILDTTYMDLDTSDRELSLETSMDQESYKPGDTASVTVKVTDKKTGETVPEGTTVLLSVVDEAIFTLSEQNIYLLSDLYRSRDLPYVTWFSSVSDEPSLLITADEETAEEKATASDTEGGENSSDTYVREEFKDTAYFAEGVTDADGNAVFEITLPDNTTTWRLTELAITSDVHAGNDTAELVSTMPYYIDTILNDTILEGESFTIGLRSAGSEVELNDSCTYKVKVEGDNYSETETVTADSIRNLAFAEFKDLKAGEYTVTVYGKCRDYKDAVRYDFSVLSSGLEIYTGLTGTVSDGMDISPLKYPVDLYVYDKSMRVYNAAISKILCSKDIRADERIASYYALKLKAKDDLYGFFEARLEEKDISDLKLTDGLLSLFPYAEGDVELTALAYIGAKDILDPDNYMQNGISDYIDSTMISEQDLPAYYMLMAAASDYMYDEQEVLDLYETSTDFKAKAYLIAAMYLSGDTQVAESAYQELMDTGLKEAKAVSGEVCLYAEEDDGTDSFDNTAAALVLSSVMEKEEREQIALYLVEKNSEQNIYPLQLMIYTEHFNTDTQESAVVSYTFDGETREEDVSNGGLHLSLNRNNFENLNMQTVSGEPYITVYYIGDIKEAGNEEKNLIGVKVEADKTSYKVGEKAEFTITPDFSNFDTDLGSNVIMVDVYIPSGMRFVEYTPEDYTFDWYLVSREGQRLRFVLYGPYDSADSIPNINITYSCVTPGDYLVESVYASSVYSDVYGLSERGSVTITE